MARQPASSLHLEDTLSNGIEDFKIYNAVEWMNCKFTYNLFLKGQIPSIDDAFVVGNYAPQLNQFYDDLKYGTLPKFSFLEPKWVASMALHHIIPATTSYRESAH